MSVNRPLERTTPPSEDSKNMPVLFGLTTSACWSGWIPFGAYGVGSQQEPAGAGSVVASHVMSVNFSTEFDERSTERPFDRLQYSAYLYAPTWIDCSRLPSGIHVVDFYTTL